MQRRLGLEEFISSDGSADPQSNAECDEGKEKAPVVDKESENVKFLEAKLDDEDARESFLDWDLLKTQSIDMENMLLSPRPRQFLS